MRDHRTVWKLPSALAVAAALAACGAEAQPRAKGGPAAVETKPMPMTPQPELPWAFGPSTADVAALTQWLERQLAAADRPETVRLPVLVELGVARSTVAGGRVLTGSKEELALSLDDTALGVSLADRARHACPGQDRCAMWLEGRWRSGRLQVTRAGGAVKDDERKRPLYAQVAVPGARLELAAHLERLGADVPLAQKHEAGDALRRAGRDAIPLLIASLGDGRPYEVRDLANRMNLPVNAKVEPVLSTVAVGARCEDLLHSIVTPAVESPPAGNFKVISTQVLRVADWRAFWAARKDKTLEQIHEELKPLAREYWKARGVTQAVP